MLKKFAGYYKNHWKLFVMDIFCAFIMSGLDLVFPLFIQRLIDTYFPNQNFNMVYRIVIILFILYIVRFILQYIVHYWQDLQILLHTNLRKNTSNLK